jgi:hypothetical protein
VAAAARGQVGAALVVVCGGRRAEDATELKWGWKKKRNTLVS